jgi:hypothetical protein
MANTTIDLVGLDFNTLKSNLKNFLKNNTQFKDIDYEGSNINVLLDVLAYNTYLNGFYTNMVASEMFLDSAQLRDSITSHAKELNYTPRSFNAAEATITVDIMPATTVQSVVVPQYTSFTTRAGSNTYTFSTNESFVLSASNNNVFKLTTKVYEGLITTESFVVNQANTKQRFVISNPTVDTASMMIVVYEDGGQTIDTYVKADNIVSIKNTSKVYFVQGAENQQYEILFGDNTFGQRPKDGSTIVVKYRATSGELPNGADVFVVDSAIDTHTNIDVVTVTPAAGGAIGESADSIKFNAPRSFQSQDRAITINDYKTLLTNRFSDIQAISVYGGEDANPPQYGKVFISVDVFNADGAPESRKKIYGDYIKQKTPLTIDVVFVDPQFMYIDVKTQVLYDVGSTTKATSDITTAVLAAISNYSLQTLEDYNVTMHYSALVEAIDKADVSIVSNDTQARIAVRIVPLTNTNYSFVIETHNELYAGLSLLQNQSEKHYGQALTSTSFKYQNADCILVDDGQGGVFIAAPKNNYIQPIVRVGNINYTTGKITVTSFNTTYFSGNYITLYFTPKSKNISSVKNTILEIAPSDVVVSVAGFKA